MQQDARCRSRQGNVDSVALMGNETTQSMATAQPGNGNGAISVQEEAAAPMVIPGSGGT
jgi:hypothetical protein